MSHNSIATGILQNHSRISTSGHASTVSLLTQEFQEKAVGCSKPRSIGEFLRRRETAPLDKRAIGKEEHAGSVRTQGLTQAFYYFHSPCSMNAAQKYGDDQRFSFINSICAERSAAAGRRPSFNIDS